MHDWRGFVVPYVNAGENLLLLVSSKPSKQSIRRLKGSHIHYYCYRTAFSHLPPVSVLFFQAICTGKTGLCVCDDAEQMLWGSHFRILLLVPNLSTVLILIKNRSYRKSHLATQEFRILKPCFNSGHCSGSGSLTIPVPEYRKRSTIQTCTPAGGQKWVANYCYSGKMNVGWWTSSSRS